MKKSFKVLLSLLLVLSLFAACSKDDKDDEKVTGKVNVIGAGYTPTAKTYVGAIELSKDVYENILLMGMSEAFLSFELTINNFSQYLLDNPELLNLSIEELEGKLFEEKIILSENLSEENRANLINIINSIKNLTNLGISNIENLYEESKYKKEVFNKGEIVNLIELNYEFKKDFYYVNYIFEDRDDDGKISKNDYIWLVEAEEGNIINGEDMETLSMEIVIDNNYEVYSNEIKPELSINILKNEINAKINFAIKEIEKEVYNVLIETALKDEEFLNKYQVSLVQYIYEKDMLNSTIEEIETKLKKQSYITTDLTVEDKEIVTFIVEKLKFLTENNFFNYNEATLLEINNTETVKLNYEFNEGKYYIGYAYEDIDNDGKLSKGDNQWNMETKTGNRISGLHIIYGADIVLNIDNEGNEFGKEEYTNEEKDDEEEPIQEKGNVEGILKDAVTGEVLGNMPVKVYKKADNANLSRDITIDGYIYVTTIYTDANGNYSSELLTGVYRLVIEIAEYIEMVYEDIVIEGNSVYYVEQISIISIEYAEKEGKISGIVTDAKTGKTVSNAVIKFRKGINNYRGEVVKTINGNELGEYTTNISSGYYTLEISASNYVSGYFNTIIYDNNIKNAAITPVLETGEIRIVLEWGAEPEDLDSHLTGPIAGETGRFHLYFPYSDTGWFGSPYPDYVRLDLDDVLSYGPETTTIYKFLYSNEVYRFSVHDYTNSGALYSKDLSQSGAKVTVYIGNSTKIFNVPTDKEGTLWTVFEMNGPTINDIKPVNTMTYVDWAGDVRSKNKTDAHLLKDLPKKK